MLPKPTTGRDIRTGAAHTQARCLRGSQEAAFAMLGTGEGGHRWAQTHSTVPRAQFHFSPATPSPAASGPFIPSLPGPQSPHLPVGSISDISRARKRPVSAWSAQHHPPLQGLPAKYQLPEELWVMLSAPRVILLRRGRDPKGRTQSLCGWQRCPSSPNREGPARARPSKRGSRLGFEAICRSVTQDRLLPATSAQLWPSSLPAAAPP